MCGIVAIVRNPVLAAAPNGQELLSSLGEARTLLDAVTADPSQEGSSGRITDAASLIAGVDRQLRALPGVHLLVTDRERHRSDGGAPHRLDHVDRAVVGRRPRGRTMD